MIDNNHLVYGGVIVVFLLGLTIIVMVGMFSLAVGFAVSMAVRFRKGRARQKHLKAAAPVKEEVVVPSLSLDSPNEGTDGRGRGRRRAADLPPVMNSVSL